MLSIAENLKLVMDKGAKRAIRVAILELQRLIKFSRPLIKLWMQVLLRGHLVIKATSQKNNNKLTF